MKSLKDKAVKGVGWSTIDTICGQGVTFLVGLVLANLLSPTEYGLIGIILIFVNISNTIVDSGFSNALIRMKDADDAAYNTGFLTNLGISALLYSLLFLSAPFIADFFNEPQLTALLRIMGIIVVINAFTLIQRTILTKNIDFKTQTKASLTSSVASGIVGIGMALYGCGVWALAGQQITRQLLNMLCLWLLSRWRPHLVFSTERFREMWSFGWKLLASSLINTTWNEAYQVIIGKCYTTAMLGQYTRARQFRDPCSTTLTTVIQRVTYPILSQMQDDRDRLREGYRRVIRLTMLVTFALMAGMIASARAMVECLVGEQWLACVPLLQLLCVMGMLYPLHAINLNMLQVQGRSDLFLRIEIFKKALAVGPLLLGIFVGIYWMLVGNIVVSLMAYWLNAYYSGPFIGYSIRSQVKDILPSLGVAATMAVPVLLMNYIPLQAWLLFPLQVVAGAAVWLLVSERLRLPEYKELKNITTQYSQR